MYKFRYLVGENRAVLVCRVVLRELFEIEGQLPCTSSFWHSPCISVCSVLERCTRASCSFHSPQLVLHEFTCTIVSGSWCSRFQKCCSSYGFGSPFLFSSFLSLFLHISLPSSVLVRQVWLWFNDNFLVIMFNFFMDPISAGAPVLGYLSILQIYLGNKRIYGASLCGYSVDIRRIFYANKLPLRQIKYRHWY